MESRRHEFDRQARELSTDLPAGPRLGVLGSSRLYHRESPEFCRLLGIALAALPRLVLVTGGVTGVGEAVGRSFHSQGIHRSIGFPVTHILPFGSSAWDYGNTLFAGEDMAERREILGRLARVYVAVEGGPGTAHESRVVLENSGYVVPVGRFGGYSREFHEELAPVPPELTDSWDGLLDASIPLERVAGLTVDLVSRLLGEENGGAPTA